MRIRGYKEEVYEVEGVGLTKEKAEREARLRWVPHGEILKVDESKKEGDVVCFRFTVRTLLFTQER